MRAGLHSEQVWSLPEVPVLGCGVKTKYLRQADRLQTEKASTVIYQCWPPTSMKAEMYSDLKGKRSVPFHAKIIHCGLGSHDPGTLKHFTPSFGLGLTFHLADQYTSWSYNSWSFEGSNCWNRQWKNSNRFWQKEKKTKEGSWQVLLLLIQTLTLFGSRLLIAVCQLWRGQNRWLKFKRYIFQTSLNCRM